MQYSEIMIRYGELSTKGKTSEILLRSLLMKRIRFLPLVDSSP